MKPLIAIDPGASGGIAWRDAEGVVRAEPMPEGMTSQVDYLRALVAGLPGVEAVIEKVGYWMPGDHPNSATKFARHCGHVEAALYALAVPFVAVAPGVWMKRLGVLPKDKQARKRAIKEEMQRRFPALSVTLATADALALISTCAAP
jgi:hypothetical protein